MRTISIINQKGGCGKTTTAINLSAALAEAGQRVLLIDLDPQSHCAAGLAVPEARIEQDISDALSASRRAKLDPKKLLWPIAERFDLIPSRTKLAAVEAQAGALAKDDEPEQRLASVLERLGAADRYDVCVLDCSPSIGLLTYNAIAAARDAIIPVETSYFSLLGAQKQQRTVRSVGRRLGVRVPTHLLPTIHDPARPLARDLLEELGRQFAAQLIPTTIRLDPRLAEAASYGRPINEYDPDSAGCADYRALAAWYLAAKALPAADAHADDDEHAPEINVVTHTTPRIKARPGHPPPTRTPSPPRHPPRMTAPSQTNASTPSPAPSPPASSPSPGKPPSSAAPPT